MNRPREQVPHAQVLGSRASRHSEQSLQGLEAPEGATRWEPGCTGCLVVCIGHSLCGSLAYTRCHLETVDPASQAKELRLQLIKLAQDQIKGARTGPEPTSGTDHVQLCPLDVLRDETGLNLFISLIKESDVFICNNSK